MGVMADAAILEQLRKIQKDQAALLEEQRETNRLLRQQLADARTRSF